MSVRWWSGRAVVLHVTALVAVLAFALMARWQVHRALSGNELSWAYAFEWPFFAVFALYMWWKLLHDDEDVSRAAPAPEDPEIEEQRAAYNRYLQSLAERSGSRR